MAQPNIASVNIGGTDFRAIGIRFGISTMNDGLPGTPVMGSIACAISVMVNLNDTANLSFDTHNTLFKLAYGVTRDKIQDITLTYWSDDSAVDVICSYSFRGWISNYITATGLGVAASKGDDNPTNHVLTLTLQPELDSTNFVKIALGN